jgi:hypothetical protein
MVIIFFSGCSTKTEYVYIKTQCPKIEVPPKVGPIEIKVVDGCICNEYKDNIIRGIRKLRSKENYYDTNVSHYNDNFTKE